MKSGIYKIENIRDGKLYIGSAVRLRERISNHRTRLNCGIHKNRHLQSAFDKYGMHSFNFSVLIVCSPDNLLFYEQRCIDGYDAVESGYNIDPVAGNSRGRARNPVSIAKMAATKRGSKQSPETIARRRAAMSTPEMKALLAEKVSAALKGKPKSADHVRKVTLAQIGKVISPETRAKLAAINLGKKNGPHSAETRQKISLAQKGRPLSPEHVAALREAWKRRRNRSDVA